MYINAEKKQTEGHLEQLSGPTPALWWVGCGGGAAHVVLQCGGGQRAIPGLSGITALDFTCRSSLEAYGKSKRRTCEVMPRGAAVLSLGWAAGAHW